MRLLVVEDEQKVASFIQQGLTEEGYAVDVASDGAKGLEMALDRIHDLIILDIALPQQALCLSGTGGRRARPAARTRKRRTAGVAGCRPHPGPGPAQRNPQRRN